MTEKFGSRAGVANTMQNLIVASKEAEAAMPTKIQKFKQEIKDRATLHNVIYIVIMLLSIAVFIGELFVTVKVLQHKHEDIPTALTILLMLASFALVGLAVADRIIAWRHLSHVTGELQDKIETCQATLEATMGAADVPSDVPMMKDVPDVSAPPASS